MDDYKHRLMPLAEEIISEDVELLGEKQVKYMDAPKDIAEAIESSEIVEDFLPPPEELVFKEAEVKAERDGSKGKKGSK